MVFLSNADGTIVKTISSQVHQGAAYVNEVVFAGPFAGSCTVTAHFRTPNGITLSPQVMAKTDGGTLIAGVDYNAWTCLLSAPVTELPGDVTVMFMVTPAGQGTEIPARIVTAPTNFPVVPGVYIAPPEEPAADLWTEIVAAISTVSGKADDNANAIKALQAKDATIEADVEGIHTDIDGIRGEVAGLQTGKLDKVTTATENSMVYAKTPEGEQQMLPFPDGTIANLQDGDGTASIQQVGNEALGPHAVALGNKSTAGVKGYYVSAVYYEGNYAYITLAKAPIAQISNSLPDIDPTFETGWKDTTRYRLSFKFLVGETYEPFHKYVNNVSISAIDHNRIRVPKTAIPEGTVSYANYDGMTVKGDNSVYCPNYPSVGWAELADAAIAAGNGAQATANNSCAAGGEAKATADYAFAAGRGTASNDNAVATGAATASGRFSHATNGARATGEYAHATNEAAASGKGAHAENYTSCEASGDYSHAEGNGKATAWQAHAENSGTANGVQSHAEGKNSVAGGEGAHAEGGNCTASAPLSHAEGSYCVAGGRASHAQGIANSTTASGQFAAGRWSKPGYDALGNQAADSAFLVRIGNGTAEANRSNAFTLDTSGTATMVAAQGSTPAITLPSHFITKEYADAHYGGGSSATYAKGNVTVSMWFAGDSSILYDGADSVPSLSQYGFFYFTDYGSNVMAHSITYLLENISGPSYQFVLPPFSTYQRPDYQPPDEILYYNYMFPNYYEGSFTQQDGKYRFDGVIYYIKKV